MSTSHLCCPGCQVCRFGQILVGLGARIHGSARLIENECEARVSVPAAALCVAKLKMDVDGAKYRQVSGSNKMTRMCDFAVALAVEGVARYCAIELKSGEPYVDEAAEQLEEGLRVITDHRVEGPLKPALRAILVVGVMSSRLIRIARGPAGRLSIAGHDIQIELVDCGSLLRI